MCLLLASNVDIAVLTLSTVPSRTVQLSSSFLTAYKQGLCRVKPSIAGTLGKFILQ